MIPGPSSHQRPDADTVRANADLAEIAGRYLELKKVGTEYEAKCPFHADRHPSFTIYRGRDGIQRFCCHACQEKGDALDFLQKIENVDLPRAIEMIAGTGYTPIPAPRPAPEPQPAAWAAIVPVPAGTPEMDPADLWNPKRDRATRVRPTRTDAYRTADGALIGYVLRAELPGGRKWTPTVTWAATPGQPARWALVAFPEPRPLQGQDEIAKRPQAPVLVVSGEKCRAVAAENLPGFVAVTWPGGDGAVGKADWTPIAGRTVTFWPDADPSGAVAMQNAAQAVLLGPNQAAAVRMIDPSDLVAEFGKGADIADLVEAGWNRAKIIAWAKERVRPWGQGDTLTIPAPVEPPAPQEKEAAPAPAATRGGAIDAGSDGAATPDNTPAPVPPQPLTGELVDLPNKPAPSSAYSAITTWSALGLSLSDKGTPNPNLDNAAALLERHPEVAGRFWYDDFLQRLLTSWNPENEPREWTDTDDVRLALWIQRKMGIGRMAVGTARDAVTAVAMAHRRNECREWLTALTWDQVPRLHTLLPIGFGAEQTPYTEAVGRCWVMGMAARGLQPGCKVDTMPVFEGLQGAGKSTALQVLVGSKWFAEASESPLSKDFFQALEGKLLVEIGEMDAFSRGEVHTIKRVISCQVDRFRAPYGRRAEDHPRQCAFAGTTNRDDWNRDETGARRFWPVACSTIDLDWIARWREQLFAEAVARVKAGEPWWDVPGEEAKQQQDARRVTDEWEPLIDEFLTGKLETNVTDILSGCLRIDAADWDKSTQMRVASCLHALKWSKTTARRGSRIVKVWSRPLDSE